MNYPTDDVKTLIRFHLATIIDELSDMGQIVALEAMHEFVLQRLEARRAESHRDRSSN